MRLSELSSAERNALAVKVGKCSQYLWQCSVGLRRPSWRLSRQLVAADGRLTLHELRPDVWDAPDSSTPPNR